MSEGKQPVGCAGFCWDTQCPHFGVNPDEKTCARRQLQPSDQVLSVSNQCPIGVQRIRTATRAIGFGARQAMTNSAQISAISVLPIIPRAVSRHSPVPRLTRRSAKSVLLSQSVAFSAAEPFTHCQGMRGLKAATRAAFLCGSSLLGPSLLGTSLLGPLA